MENENQINQVQNNESTTSPEVQKMQLPNLTGVLVFGILSIVGFCCIAGIIGVIFGVLALVFGTKAQKEARENPDKYTEVSIKNNNAGKICGIIGLSLSALWLIGFIIKVTVLGLALGSFFSAFPWETINF